MPVRDIALIGVGRMGGALARGWLKARPEVSIALVDPALEQVPEGLRGRAVALNPAVEPAACVVVAVKPQVFAAVAPDIAVWVRPETLVLSIMAGVKIETLSEALGSSRVVRAMPNTPGAVGQGISVISAGAGIGAEDIDLVRQQLAPLGTVEGPVDEALMSAVTGVSGSGPAYVFHLVETMAAAGEAEGLPPDLALTLARQTVIGAAALLAETGEPADALRKAVTSPGGTTQAALQVLMDEDGMPSLMKRAIAAAAARERALSET